MGQAFWIILQLVTWFSDSQWGQYELQIVRERYGMVLPSRSMFCFSGGRRRLGSVGQGQRNNGGQDPKERHCSSMMHSAKLETKYDVHSVEIFTCSRAWHGACMCSMPSHLLVLPLCHNIQQASVHWQEMQTRSYIGMLQHRWTWSSTTQRRKRTMHLGTFNLS